ncbi:MAG: YdcH family protein [Polyangiaceae bacterium]
MNETATTLLQQLEQEHQHLKDEVKRLERRAHLTPPEQLEVAQLKKRKLVAKDQIAALRRDD